MLFSLCLGLAVTVVAARAGNGPETWNPSGAGANWGGTGASGNWTGANTPPITGDGLIFGGDNNVGSGSVSYTHLGTKYGIAYSNGQDRRVLGTNNAATLPAVRALAETPDGGI